MGGEIRGRDREPSWTGLLNETSKNCKREAEDLTFCPVIPRSDTQIKKGSHIEDPGCEHGPLITCPVFISYLFT